jgi:hypothetical protein
MALVHLIYVSSARAELGVEALKNILSSSDSHNTQLQVTGMLLYFNGSFMQVIEGEEAAVDETYARILLDPRHTGVILIERKPIETRSFSRWSMGFKSLRAAAVADLPAFAPFFSSGFDLASIGGQQGLAKEMLELFAGNHRR